MISLAKAHRFKPEIATYIYSAYDFSHIMLPNWQLPSHGQS